MNADVEKKDTVGCCSLSRGGGGREETELKQF